MAANIVDPNASNSKGDYVFTLHDVLMEQYTVLEFLGRGSFGKVVKCSRKGSKEMVAVKICGKINDPYFSKPSRNELSILRKLSSVNPDEFNFVRAFEYFIHHNHTCFVFELLDQTLSNFLKKNGGPIQLNSIRPIVNQVLTALLKLKELNIVHTDLKPSNIMLIDNKSRPLQVKVIDFGCSKINPRPKCQSEWWLQSRYYRAPEITLGLPFSEAIDIWSLGCIIAELFLGCPLFPGPSRYDQLRYILDITGMPPYSMLNDGTKTVDYFNRWGPYWIFKLATEYKAEENFESKECRLYKFNCLDDIAKVNVINGLEEHEMLLEKEDRREFIDLLKRMLAVDQECRITPAVALTHNFITRKHLSTTYTSCKYCRASCEIMNIACKKKLRSRVFIANNFSSTLLDNVVAFHDYCSQKPDHKLDVSARPKAESFTTENVSESAKAAQPLGASSPPRPSCAFPDFLFHFSQSLSNNPVKPVNPPAEHTTLQPAQPLALHKKPYIPIQDSGLNLSLPQQVAALAAPHNVQPSLGVVRSKPQQGTAVAAPHNVQPSLGVVRSIPQQGTAVAAPHNVQPSLGVVRSKPQQGTAVAAPHNVESSLGVVRSKPQQGTGVAAPPILQPSLCVVTSKPQQAAAVAPPPKMQPPLDVVTSYSNQSPCTELRQPESSRMSNIVPNFPSTKQETNLRMKLTVPMVGSESHRPAVIPYPASPIVITISDSDEEVEYSERSKPQQGTAVAAPHNVEPSLGVVISKRQQGTAVAAPPVLQPYLCVVTSKPQQAAAVAPPPKMQPPLDVVTSYSNQSSCTELRQPESSRMSNIVPNFPSSKQETNLRMKLTVPVVGSKSQRPAVIPYPASPIVITISDSDEEVEYSERLIEQSKTSSNTQEKKKTPRRKKEKTPPAKKRRSERIAACMQKKNPTESLHGESLEKAAMEK